MENPTLEHLEKALYDFMNALANEWKLNLKRDGKKASGALINSIKPVPIKTTINQIIGSLNVKDYWKYVEKGRKPGKFPPIDKIEKWIEVKPVVPRPVNGVKPTKKQLAFLIARKIAEDGIKPGKQFEEAFNRTWRLWEPTILKAIDEDIDNWMTLILKNI